MWWYSTVYILQVKSHIPVHVVPLRFTCKVVQDTLHILYLQDGWVGTCTCITIWIIHLLDKEKYMKQSFVMVGIL